ncbi:MAG: CPBP family intramembrane metalloprotease [Bacteroidia bacterium]|jgi:membrane protease YdiL (CAAX protease family)|nr:CPBP family intramembrane metalloprotease [Bacteroidia bacterium]
MNLEQNETLPSFARLGAGRQFVILMCFFLAGLILFSLLGVLCITAIAHVSLYDIQGLNDYKNPALVLGLQVAQIVSSVGSFILPALAFAFLSSHNAGGYLQINNPGKITVLLTGGLIMWCAMPLINYLAELNSHLSLPSFMSGIEQWMKDSEKKADDLTNAFLAHQSFPELLLNLFMIGLLAAFCEELFFRATLQKIMIQWTKNVHAGIWVTGILFSFLHFEFYGFLPRMLMGVYLGYLFFWSKSLWVSVFAHFLNNATAVLFAYIEERNIVPKDIDQVGSVNSQIVYVIVSAAIVGLLVFLLYRITHPKNGAGAAIDSPV